MTQPRATRIMQRRHWALVIMRTVSLLMIVYGGTFIVQAIGSAFGLASQRSSFIVQLIGVFWGNNYNPFWYGVGLTSVGAGLGAGSRRLSRWLIPLIANECPACGYQLRQLTTTRCPECGYEIQPSERSTASN